MSKATILYAPAKINLCLNILSRRVDGYHELESIMLPVGLFDRISISLTEHNPNTFEFRTTNPHLNNIPYSQNLLYRAAKQFFSALEHPFPGIKCQLEKNIPMGSGLGGGSSDAASLLLYLNRFYGHPFSKADLCRIASEVGMDVPFFIISYPSLVRGKGQIIEPFSMKESLYCVIIWPEINIKTRQAYQWIQEQKFQDRHITRDLKNILTNPDWKNFEDKLFNDFEKAIFPRYPVLKTIKKGLSRYNPLGAVMSGSGSAVFALFNDQISANNAYQGMKRKYDKIFLVKTLPDNVWRS